MPIFRISLAAVVRDLFGVELSKESIPTHSSNVGAVPNPSCAFTSQLIIAPMKKCARPVSGSFASFGHRKSPDQMGNSLDGYWLLPKSGELIVECAMAHIQVLAWDSK